MHRNLKSATCCYCGTETILTLGKSGRSELKCAACGAPWSRLKALRKEHVESPYTVRGKKGFEPYQPKRPSRETKKHRKKKRERTFTYYLMEAAEEIIDFLD